jgi:hypothetical protein
MSSKAWGNTYILPSKSDLQFDFRREAYTASAQVANLTSRYIKEHVFAAFEVVSDYEYHPITQESQKQVLQGMKTRPPAGEILPLTNNVEINLPLLTACNVIIDENGEKTKRI